MCIGSHALHTAPYNSEVNKLLKNCGSLVRNLLHVTLIALRIWRSIPDFSKICGPLEPKCSTWCHWTPV